MELNKFYQYNLITAALFQLPGHADLANKVSANAKLQATA